MNCNIVMIIRPPCVFFYFEYCENRRHSDSETQSVSSHTYSLNGDSRESLLSHRSRSIQVYQGVLTQEQEYTGMPGSPYTGVGVQRYTRESLHMSRSIQVYQRVLTQELEYTSIPGSPYTGVGVYRYTMESLHRSWSIPGSPYTEFGVYRYTRESLHRSWSIQVYQGVLTQELEYTGIPGSP